MKPKKSKPTKPRQDDNWQLEEYPPMSVDNMKDENLWRYFKRNYETGLI